MKNIEVCLFASPVSLSHAKTKMQEIVRLIQYDNLILERTGQYREMLRVMGKKTANENIKRKNMPAFGVAVSFTGYGHGSERAAGWTGLAMCDIDNFESTELLETAFERLSKDPHVLLMYRTISGTGLRIIYTYERQGGKPIDDTSWRGAFVVGNEHLASLAGHGYDASCKDYSRLSGLAHDANLYVNYEAAPFIVPNDLIVEENCESQDHGRPRKHYATDSFNPEAEEAWPRVQQMLMEKHIKYEAHHHHDYILHAAYLFNRFGVSLDALLVFACQIWNDYPKDERERAIRHQYKKTDNHGTWHLSGKKKGRENAMITLPELRMKVIEHLFIRYNEVTDQLVYRFRKPDDDDELLDSICPITSPEWEIIDETKYNDFRYLIADDTGKRVLLQDVRSVIESSLAKKIHPVRQYMEKLPGWDGTDRVSELEQHIHVRRVTAEKR